MAKQVHPPRGMRDFLPQDKARREHAFSVIRRVYRAHGFDEIETPVMETYERLHSGLGGDNEKLSFSILKRGLEPEDFTEAATDGVEHIVDLGLRFDLTVPLTRFYATNRAQLPPVFRAIQIAPVWRAERPQKGRYRQFVQADIDIIGESAATAEVELITATSQALEELGLENVTIRMNDRRLLFGLLEHCGFPSTTHEQALITVDKLDKIGVAGVVEELRELDTEAAQRMGEVLDAVADDLLGDGIGLTETEIRSHLPSGITGPGIDNLVALGTALEGALPAGVTLRFDPTLVRGMGYYTGTIYEVAHPASGSSVGGGGRYDGMVGRFLGQDVPAVGFSIGFERIVDLISLPAGGEHPSLALVYDTNVPLRKLVDFKRELLTQGYRVRLEKRQKNMKTLHTRIQKEGFTHVASLRENTSSVEDLEIRTLE